MTNKLIVTAFSAALAGCGAAASDTGALEPGEWELVMETTAFDVPGADPIDLEAAQLDANLGYPDMQQACLSQTDLDGGLRRVVHDVMIAAENCTADSITMVDGRLSGAIRCIPDAQRRAMAIALDGDYAADRFAITARSQIVGDDFPEGEANSTVTFAGTRLGDCE